MLRRSLKRVRLGRLSVKIENVALDTIELDPDNARTHSSRNLETIKESLAAFGQRKPVVLFGNTVIAGNGTVEAARSLGWSKIAVTRVPPDWTLEQAKAYAIADNRTSELAEWDGNQLLKTLSDFDADALMSTGFNQEDLDALMKVWGPAPDLDELYDDIGDPTEEDDWQVIRARVPEDVYQRWNECLKSTGEKDLSAIIMVIDVAHRALVL